jgi:hypothetical protein
LAEKQLPDYYEVLMISPQADRPMIEWAVRLMLSRYGKKDGQEAQPEQLLLIKEAYRTLADPKRRAAYDKQQREAQPPSKAPAGVSAEPQLMPVQSAGGRLTSSDIRTTLTATRTDVRFQQKLRQGVLSALYDVFITEPRNPELGRAEMARAIGARNDDLDFTIWYLREQALIRTTNQGLYTITSKGVEFAENGGVPHLSFDSPTVEVADSEQQPKLPAVVAGPQRVS